MASRSSVSFYLKFSRQRANQQAGCSVSWVYIKPIYLFVAPLGGFHSKWRTVQTNREDDTTLSRPHRAGPWSDWDTILLFKQIVFYQNKCCPSPLGAPQSSSSSTENWGEMFGSETGEVRQLWSWRTKVQPQHWNISNNSRVSSVIGFPTYHPFQPYFANIHY